MFSRPPHDRLFQFVREAIQTLKSGFPGFITEGLVRVDVFETMAGDLVVNEFESLDAAYYSTQIEDEMKVKVYLQNYWNAYIVRSIEEAKYIYSLQYN